MTETVRFVGKTVHRADILLPRSEYRRLFAELLHFGSNSLHNPVVGVHRQTNMTNPQTSWQFWALLSAVFAALTAIFAKVGVEEVNSDFATFFRTIIILVVLGGILFVTNQFQPLRSISAKSYSFLCLSGLATGASWVCYFRALKIGNASQVAPIDKLSVVLVAIFGFAFLSEKLSLGNWLGICLISAGALLVAMK